MCDLWKNTLAESVPPGAIPKQLDDALAELRQRFPGTIPRQLKLYNSGSFFDPRAIPPEDHPAIAAQVSGFERVIVECHPALVGDRALRFRDRLSGRLEVAMGLETVHPEVLPRLNKRMTLAQFAAAANFLRREAIDLRVFVLVKPPFLDEATALVWAKRSLDFAAECGAAVTVLIPTRDGNGAMEALAAQGLFAPPRLETLEESQNHGIALGRGRVFADLWDLERLNYCEACFPRRRERLARINLSQCLEPLELCGCARPAGPEAR
jgi:radical SAM enzyme (TIGR01210 family)